MNFFYIILCNQNDYFEFMEEGIGDLFELETKKTSDSVESVSIDFTIDSTIDSIDGAEKTENPAEKTETKNEEEKPKVSNEDQTQEQTENEDKEEPNEENEEDEAGKEQEVNKQEVGKEKKSNNFAENLMKELPLDDVYNQKEEKPKTSYRKLNQDPEHLKRFRNQIASFEQSANGARREGPTYYDQDNFYNDYQGMQHESEKKDAGITKNEMIFLGVVCGVIILFFSYDRIVIFFTSDFKKNSSKPNGSAQTNQNTSAQNNVSGASVQQNPVDLINQLASDGDDNLKQLQSDLNPQPSLVIEQDNSGVHQQADAQNQVQIQQDEAKDVLIPVSQEVKSKISGDQSKNTGQQKQVHLKNPALTSILGGNEGNVINPSFGGIQKLNELEDEDDDHHLSDVKDPTDVKDQEKPSFFDEAKSAFGNIVQDVKKKLHGDNNKKSQIISFADKTILEIKNWPDNKKKEGRIYNLYMVLRLLFESEDNEIKNINLIKTQFQYATEKDYRQKFIKLINGVVDLPDTATSEQILALLHPIQQLKILNSSGQETFISCFGNEGTLFKPFELIFRKFAIKKAKLNLDVNRDYLDSYSGVSSSLDAEMKQITVTEQELNNPSKKALEIYKELLEDFVLFIYDRRVFWAQVCSKLNNSNSIKGSKTFTVNILNNLFQDLTFKVSVKVNPKTFEDITLSNVNILSFLFYNINLNENFPDLVVNFLAQQIFKNQQLSESFNFINKQLYEVSYRVQYSLQEKQEELEKKLTKITENLEKYKTDQEKLVDTFALKSVAIPLMEDVVPSFLNYFGYTQKEEEIKEKEEKKEINKAFVKFIKTELNGLLNATTNDTFNNFVGSFCSQINDKFKFLPQSDPQYENLLRRFNFAESTIITTIQKLFEESYNLNKERFNYQCKQTINSMELGRQQLFEKIQELKNLDINPLQPNPENDIVDISDFFETDLDPSSQEKQELGNVSE